MNRRIELVKSALLAMQRHAWEQGVAAQAFLELGDEAWAIRLAREAVCRQAADGRLAMVGSETQVTDPAANGEAVLFAANATGEAGLAQAAQKMLDYLLHIAPHTSDGVLYHVNNAPQVWVDALYMAPPFLAAAGRVEEACHQVDGMRSRLWNEGKQMFAHIWNEKRRAFDRAACWGVGNGWAAAGMTRLLRALPGEAARERRQLIDYIHRVLDGCLKYQRPDSLFHDVVDDPLTFVETNLAQMLAYTIFRGMQGGWLEQSYGPLAEGMRRAAHAKVDSHGLVRDVCGAPDFDRPGVAPEGQAFFLLMEAAARDAGQSEITR
jgi:rhamnogalacturonyl hydrolase YesR